MDLTKYDPKIFTNDIADFESVALEVFRFQHQNNAVYKDYCDALKLNPAGIHSIDQVPFLPIRFFKSYAIKTTEFKPAMIFESSGTTGSVSSKHLIKDLALYEHSFMTGFTQMYGSVTDYCIIGLLPSYLERKTSSLVYMVAALIKKSANANSGFYLHEYEKLSEVLDRLEKAGQKTIVIAVTFALLDFAEKYKIPLNHTIIMETGGMKGRREEMIRQEVHDVLKASFQLQSIHSEYGMTELLSQAYSRGNGVFTCPPWMKVLIRDDEDPLSVYSQQSSAGSRQSVSGAINVIDLANIYSCSFIATDDAGKLYDDGSFEVLGRMDNSDLRGCSLLAIS